MKETVLQHKAGKTIFVTEIRQFALPASIHIDTIRKAVQQQSSRLTLDLHGYKSTTRVWDHANKREAHEHLVGGMIDWLKQYGVYVGTGNYFEEK